MGKKEQTENIIIRAAIAEFNERGYDGASTNDIAKKAGVAKGSVFLRFETKEKLYYSCLERIMEDFAVHAQQLRFAGDQDIFDKIKQFLDLKANYYLNRREESKFIYNNYYHTKGNKELQAKSAAILTKSVLPLRAAVMEFEFSPGLYKEGVTKESILAYLDIITSGFNARFDRAVAFEEFPIAELFKEWEGIIGALKYGIMRQSS